MYRLWSVHLHLYSHHFSRKSVTIVTATGEHATVMPSMHQYSSELRRKGIRVCCSTPFRFRLHERRFKTDVDEDDMHLYWCADCKTPGCKKRQVFKDVDFTPDASEDPTIEIHSPAKFESSRCAVKRAAPFTATRWVTLRTFNPMNLCRSDSKLWETTFESVPEAHVS